MFLGGVGTSSLPSFHRGKIAPGGGRGSRAPPRVSFGVDVSDEDGPKVDIKWRLSPDRIRGAELSRGPNGKVCCGVGLRSGGSMIPAT